MNFGEMQVKELSIYVDNINTKQNKDNNTTVNNIKEDDTTVNNINADNTEEDINIYNDLFRRIEDSIKVINFVCPICEINIKNNMHLVTCSTCSQDICNICLATNALTINKLNPLLDVNCPFCRDPVLDAQVVTDSRRFFIHNYLKATNSEIEPSVEEELDFLKDSLSNQIN
jgi:hypothetical protein